MHTQFSTVWRTQKNKKKEIGGMNKNYAALLHPEKPSISTYMFLSGCVQLLARKGSLGSHSGENLEKLGKVFRPLLPLRK